MASDVRFVKVTIYLDDGGAFYDEFPASQVKQRIRTIGQEGYFMETRAGILYYPPHRIHFVKVLGG